MDASLIQIIIGALGTIVVAAITSLLSLQAVRVQERRQRARDETDNAEKVSNMAVGLLKPYEDQLAKLQNRLELQDKRIEAQDKLILDLRCELRNERDRRTDLETLVREKDDRIATMQTEIDRIPGMQAEIDGLRKQLDGIKSK